MAVLKEFICAAHGEFEEFVNGDETPYCPHGCSPRFVNREIRTVVASRSNSTDRMDHLIDGIAKEHRLSDIKVGKDDGQSVMQNLRRGEKASDFGAYWGKNVNLSEFKPTEALSNQKMPQVRPDIIDGRVTGKLPEA